MDDKTIAIFSNDHNEYMHPIKTRKWILHVQDKNYLGTITTHCLRHTHCSLLIEAVASLKVVQNHSGHTGVQTMMNIYTHVTRKVKEEAILKFANYIEM
jgi:integrase